MTQHKDQLIEDALALLKDAVRVEPFQTQNTLPPAQFSSTETNVVVATHPNGSVVAPSSVVIVSIDDSEPPNAAPPEVENQGASSSKETEHPHADLVEQTLSLMQTTAEQQKIAVSPAEGLPPRLPSPKKLAGYGKSNHQKSARDLYSDPKPISARPRGVL